MQNFNQNILIENKRLKNEFSLLNLDPMEVLQTTPFNPELENRRMASLLSFVKLFQKNGSQEVMQLLGHLFPPIYPMISPDSDWYRFERWMQGKSVRDTIQNQLPEDFEVKSAEDLSDEEVKIELDKLLTTLGEKGYSIQLQELPARLAYKSVLEWLENEVDLCPGGGWTYDGCSGYCPGCIQRPWCDTGQNLGWQEDLEAGKMHLPDSLKDYVSAIPLPYELITEAHDEQDKKMEEFNTEMEDGKADMLSGFSQN